MGETRVDLLRLLEDLRDAYPGPLEETILTETVANALDSGSATIAISADPAARTFTVVDDGGGMSRRALARYHDLAMETRGGAESGDGAAKISSFARAWPPGRGAPGPPTASRRDSRPPHGIRHRFAPRNRPGPVRALRHPAAFVGTVHPVFRPRRPVRDANGASNAEVEWSSASG